MPAQVASPSAPPSLADSLSHIDLKCSADLLVGEKMVKNCNGALKFVPFYGPFSLPACPSLFSFFFPKKGKSCCTCSPPPVVICVADFWGCNEEYFITLIFFLFFFC